MQFRRDGDWYLVTRITGPTHNLLGLKFGGPGDALPVIERLSIENEAPVVEADEVQRQVLEGVSEANSLLGTDYRVAAIRFVVSDTPSPSVYRLLAQFIVERARDGALPV